MKENQRYNIKIGELYIYGIYVSSDNSATKFIRGIDLNVDEGESYNSKEVVSIINTLDEIGINKEMITVEIIN